MENNLYRVTPRTARSFMSDCLYAGLVPFLQSSPGMGKSSIVKSIAQELNLHLIDHRLSTSVPEDLSGLPKMLEDSAKFVPFDSLFPVQNTKVPDKKDGFMLFLDEFNSAPKSVQAACYKLILDRQTGQYDLHDRTAIVLAGNLASDRAIVNNIGTAMQSRVVHIEMEVSFDEWLQDVAIPQGYDPRIIAYLSFKPSMLMDFRPDHNEKTFCCPRTWEFMNRLIKGRPVTEDKTALYAGTITSGAAADFVQFTAVESSMVTVKQVMADPSGANVPNDIPTKWMIVSHLIELVDDDNFGPLSTYVNRYDLTFRILFYRSVMVRNPSLRKHPAFASAMSELSRYLNG